VIKLKSIKLRNYCGYRDFELDLSEGDGVKKWQMFYGPNGSFKSTFLRAVELLSSPRMILGRVSAKLFLRRLTYHSNYQPSYIGFDKLRTNLYMEATFLTDDGDKRIVLENNWDDKVGLTTNELPLDIISAASFIDADNPNNMYSFQIRDTNEESFLDMAESVYNLKCYLPEESLVKEKDISNGKDILLYTDFVIIKYGDTLVHYKSFSDGEKKIATLLSALFRRSREADILLIDNIAQHIYFKRHMDLISKIDRFFPSTQILATTHSSTIISGMNEKYLVDMEKNIL